MIVHVYSIMRNEEFFLPYFLRYYSTFADKIFIIDDHSTDKTVEIARENKKVTVLKYDYDISRGYNEQDHIDAITKAYKKYSRGRADWVMCADGDEIIYNKDIIGNFEKLQKKGIRIVRTTAYAMFTGKLPKTNKQIYEDYPYGVRERRYDKPVVFDPELDIVFGEGRHFIISPTEIWPQRGKLFLLHYRYLSREYFKKRSTKLLARLNLTARLRTDLLKGGLHFYDKTIKTKLEKVV